MAKLKVKTNRSAAKRFKVTATGKILRKQSGASHLLRKKSSRRKRRLSKWVEVPQELKSHVKKLIPYKF